MIKLNVTDEIVDAFVLDEDGDPDCACRKCLPRKLARALAVVQEDVNSAMVMLGQFGGGGAKFGSAEIEVEG